MLLLQLAAHYNAIVLELMRKIQMGGGMIVAMMSWCIFGGSHFGKCRKMFNQSINQTNYFIVRLKIDQRAGQLSLPHLGITKTEKNRTKT